MATRHILTADSRSSFVPYIDTMLDERVLVGTGISSRESLRPLAYSVVADLIHHVRNELPLDQLARIVHVFSCNLNDATFSLSIQTMCAKLLNTIIESVHSKGNNVEALRILRGMFFSSLDKLVAVNDAHDRLKAVNVKGKGKTDEDRWRDIELAMPVQAVAYATDSLDTFQKGMFQLITLLTSRGPIPFQDPTPHVPLNSHIRATNRPPRPL